jgi:hypothetical protein
MHKDQDRERTNERKEKYARSEREIKMRIVLV